MYGYFAKEYNSVMSLRTFLVRHKKVILLILVGVLAARVFLPQMSVLADCLKTLEQANPILVVIAALFYFTGIPVLAIQFTALSFKKLVFALTLRVQAATMFVNKLVPQGVGTISLNIFYMIKKKHTPSEATAVVTMNAITSTTAYIILIILALIFSDISLNSIFGKVHFDLNVDLWLVIFLIGIGITLLNASGLKQRIVSTWHALKDNLGTYKKRPKSILVSTFFNGIGTSLNILALMTCAKAIGIDITFADALLAYTFGNFAATFIPTPGGLGSAEMGIYSGLLLTGLNSTDAMSVTLLYRLVSYWLPILPGYYYFHSLKKTIFADYAIKGKEPA